MSLPAKVHEFSCVVTCDYDCSDCSDCHIVNLKL